MFLGELPGFRWGNGAIHAGSDRGASQQRCAACLGLGPHLADGFSGWADKRNTGIRARRGKIRILAEEAIARVDRFDAVLLSRLENSVDAQITLAGWRWAQALGFVGEANVQRSAVGIGIDRHAADPHLAEGADDTNGDLAAVGDQYLAKHEARIVSVWR